MVTWCSPKNRLGLTEEAAIAAMAEVVIKHRNHPALLGWCHLDEPGNRPTIFTKEYVEKWYRLIKHLDPYHPCISSHLTRLGEVDVYGDAVDLALMPFVDSPRYEHLFQEFWDYGLPVAVNPPCYDAGVRKSAPTPSEQRVRTYKALALGACGSCTYTYRCTTMATWREFERIGEELKVLGPILATPDDRARVDAMPRGKGLFARAKAHGDGWVVLAVNTSLEPVDARFRLPDAPSLTTVTPMFGSPQARADAEARTLNVTLPGQGTGVYEVTL
jgi:hypothetical protein